MAKSQDFSVGFRSAQVAALPWRMGADGRLLVLLVTSRTNKKWMLPKGWPMRGKADHEAALIETQEEAGVEGVACTHPIGSYRYLRLLDDGQVMPAQARVYPIQVTHQSESWSEQHQRKRRWVGVKKASELVFEADLKRFLIDLKPETLVLFGGS